MKIKNKIKHTILKSINFFLLDFIVFLEGIDLLLNRFHYKNATLFPNTKI